MRKASSKFCLIRVWSLCLDLALFGSVLVLQWNPASSQPQDRTANLDQALPSDSNTDDSPVALRLVENNSFGVGEKLDFDITYGPISAGNATMEVKEIVTVGGYPCYHIASTARSNALVSRFFYVEDYVYSYVDARGIFSWKFEKKIQEGKYKTHRIAEFDHRNRIVKTERNDTLTIPPFTQDALSALFYVRTQKLEIGKSLYVDAFSDGKQYQLEVKVHRREKITVPAGTFKCIVVEPLLQASGIFEHKGRLTVWLTDDRLRMPVLMKSKVIVGAISAELTAYTFGKLQRFQ